MLLEPQIQGSNASPGHGRVDQLFTFAGLLEASWEFGHPVYMVFFWTYMDRQFGATSIVMCVL